MRYHNPYFIYYMKIVHVQADIFLHNLFSRQSQRWDICLNSFISLKNTIVYKRTYFHTLLIHRRNIFKKSVLPTNFIYMLTFFLISSPDPLGQFQQTLALPLKGQAQALERGDNYENIMCQPLMFQKSSQESNNLYYQNFYKHKLLDFCFNHDPCCIVAFPL